MLTQQTYITKDGIELIVEPSKYKISSNILDVYFKGAEDKIPFFITEEGYADAGFMDYIAIDLKDGYKPNTNRKILLTYKSIPAAADHKTLATLIQTHLDLYPASDGEEITNVAYCPQTKTLTVKSITHKIIQL